MSKSSPLAIGWKKLLIFSVLFSVFVFSKAQENAGYKILVAGHAYGAHSGVNIGLHPPFLEKLKNEQNGNVLGLFLTGDIVNTSTSASWAQVAAELSGLGLTSFYVMGNHDDNTIGHNIFQQKHGGLYYYFSYRNDLFIILNSTESDRSISAAQLSFLDQIFSKADLTWNRAFIFFHEVIWNSDIKYRLVRSNSRSRYDQIKNVSNFWQGVFPRLTAFQDKKFYLFAGDVGGNPDAVAAFYDRRQNVTLLSSGMGEVPDENYMSVNILPDTVTFSLIALDDDIQMHPIDWYSVPEKPKEITGSKFVTPVDSPFLYAASPVENATSYQWSFSNGITGSSNQASVDAYFDAAFQSGKIGVKAVNDGFGESEATELDIKAVNTSAVEKISAEERLKVYQSSNALNASFSSKRSDVGHLKIFDLSGRLLHSEKWNLISGENTKSVSGDFIHPGILLFQFVSDYENISTKAVFR